MLISRRWLWTLGLWAITTVMMAAQDATTLTGVVTTSADGLSVPGFVGCVPSSFARDGPNAPRGAPLRHRLRVLRRSDPQHRLQLRLDVRRVDLELASS